MTRRKNWLLACRVLAFSSALGGVAVSPAYADEQAPAATAPTSAADERAAAEAPTSGSEEGKVGGEAKTKDQAKSTARPLTVVAEEGEAARLATITDVVRGWPLKVVASTAEGAAPASAAFVLRTGLQPAASKVAGAREVKLFTERLHVVAGASVTRMEDLRGRPVSFGPNGGRNQEAARKAFRALGIAVAETPLDMDNALDGVATGDVAAVVLLAPAPVPRLKSISQSGLHLIAWPDGGAMPSGAVATAIPADTYPNLTGAGAAVSTLGAESVLALTPHGATLPAAKRFLDAVAQHAPTLSKRGFELMAANRERHDERHLASAERR